MEYDRSMWLTGANRELLVSYWIAGWHRMTVIRLLSTCRIMRSDECRSSLWTRILILRESPAKWRDSKMMLNGSSVRLRQLKLWPMYDFRFFGNCILSQYMLHCLRNALQFVRFESRKWPLKFVQGHPWIDHTGWSRENRTNFNAL